MSRLNPSSSAIPSLSSRREMCEVAVLDADLPPPDGLAPCASASLLSEAGARTEEGETLDGVGRDDTNRRGEGGLLSTGLRLKRTAAD